MAPNKSKQAPSPSSTKLFQFTSIDLHFSLRQKNALREWFLLALKKEKKKPGFISFNFCSDNYLLRVNKKYLNHNYYTDIITFELNDADEISGDIYISIDRVKENAKSNNSTFHVELRRVMIHGVLHLCGYKDKAAKDIKTMRMKEDYYLSLVP